MSASWSLSEVMWTADAALWKAERECSRWVERESISGRWVMEEEEEEEVVGVVVGEEEEEEEGVEKGDIPKGASRASF